MMILETPLISFIQAEFESVAINAHFPRFKRSLVPNKWLSGYNFHCEKECAPREGIGFNLIQQIIKHYLKIGQFLSTINKINAHFAKTSTNFKLPFRQVCSKLLRCSIIAFNDLCAGNTSGSKNAKEGDYTAASHFQNPMRKIDSIKAFLQGAHRHE